MSAGTFVLRQRGVRQPERDGGVRLLYGLLRHVLPTHRPVFGSKYGGLSQGLFLWTGRELDVSEWRDVPAGVFGVGTGDGRFFRVPLYARVDGGAVRGEGGVTDVEHAEVDADSRPNSGDLGAGRRNFPHGVRHHGPEEEGHQG